ncbi:MAG: preprotein translocase subunit SecG [Bacteroidaceae bacterium]|nr:preprotein translocase subunit SecG [Bacteroidaceae bacterium]
MYLVCVLLIVIASVLMCLIVLVQNSKGGGLASGFASSNQIMGVRKTTDFLEKATWSLAAFMVVACIVAAWSLPGITAQEEGLTQSAIESSAVNPEVVPNLTEELPAEVTVETPAE